MISLVTASKYFRYFVGGFNIAHSLNDINNTVSDSSLSANQKIHRVATDSLVASAQALSMVADYRQWPVDERIQLRGTLAVAQVLQEGSIQSCKKSLKLDDHIDLGCSVTFQVFNLLDDVIELKPIYFGAYLPEVQFTASALSLVWAGTQVATKVVIPVIKYLCQQPNQINVMILIDRLGDGDPELRIDQRLYADMRRIKAAPNIQALTEIPELFKNDTVLSQFRCPLLDDRPIRHILVVKGTENSPNPVYYDRSAMAKRLREHPDQNPPGWPEKIPFNRYALRKDPYIQNLINQRLTMLWNDFKLFPDLPDPQRDENLLKTLSQSVGIHDAQRSDKQVLSELFKKVPRSVAANITSGNVQTIQHAFAENRPPKPARVITLRTLSFKGAAQFSVAERQHALLGLLGSNIERDQQLAEKVIRAFKKIEIYIATDLKIAFFKWS